MLSLEAVAMLSEQQRYNDAEPDRYTMAYRAAEASQVMRWINAGQSGSIIGLRGTGKSNFLRFLLRDAVRQHYLEPNGGKVALILVDRLALTEHVDWAIWELMLDRLLPELRIVGSEPQFLDEIAALHREVMRTKDPLIARRAVEQAVAFLCDRLGYQVVFIFDDFDTLFISLDPRLFLGLRSLRDAHKDRVSYLVAVSDDLSNLRNEIGEVERFAQLVSQNVCDVGPCNEADARQIIHYHASQRSLKLDEDDIVRLITLSGGHAGLLKVILRLLWSAPSSTRLAVLAPTLMNEQLVQTECRKLWDSLPENERLALRRLTDKVAIDRPTQERLKRRGLIHNDAVGSSAIFSPLFADFVRRAAITSPASRVIIKRDTREVEIDGRKVTNLTELEFEAFCYLYEHRGQVCTKDELIEHVYRLQHERMKGGVSDETLQTLISRLRDKIELDRGPRYVLTVRGEGYRFVEPGER
jgi:DNA-binding winged helix-turn-helix (wHTH) protein